MFVLYIDTNSLLKASTNPTDDAADGAAFSKEFVQFSEKDLSGIRKIAEYGGNNVFRLLVNSLCPPIFGHDLVKAGLVLGLLGGRRRIGSSTKEITIRGDPHILVVGDPGMGKSQMLSSTVKIAARGVYVCGNTTTTAGLTVTMSKDSETGDTVLEAGALVLSDQGNLLGWFDKQGSVALTSLTR
jgi:DNA helicase MCM8